MKKNYNFFYYILFSFLLYPYYYSMAQPNKECVKWFKQQGVT